MFFSFQIPLNCVLYPSCFFCSTVPQHYINLFQDVFLQLIGIIFLAVLLLSIHLNLSLYHCFAKELLCLSKQFTKMLAVWLHISWEQLCSLRDTSVLTVLYSHYSVHLLPLALCVLSLLWPMAARRSKRVSLLWLVQRASHRRLIHSSIRWHSVVPCFQLLS